MHQIVPIHKPAMLASSIFVATLAVTVIGHPFGELPAAHGGGAPRIVGGVEAPSQYGAHMAALVWGERIKSLICGSSIVSKRHILTAAHCIEPMVIRGELFPSFHAVVGSNRWDSDTTVARFSHYKNHPEYDRRTIKNDIGVLYLTEDLVLNAKVAVINLNFKWIDGGENCFVTGWGRLGTWWPIPDYLQLLHVETISAKQCAKNIYEASLWWGSAPPLDPEIEICTFHSYGHGMCNGDSGSALVAKENGHQIGIVSWGFPCARGAPDVFVRISGTKDFIVSALGKNLSDIKDDTIIV